MALYCKRYVEIKIIDGENINCREHALGGRLLVATFFISLRSRARLNPAMKFFGARWSPRSITNTLRVTLEALFERYM